MKKVVLFVFALIMSVASGVYAGNKKPAGSKRKQKWQTYSDACDYDKMRTKPQDKKEKREASRDFFGHVPRNTPSNNSK